jgi:hypothetical protein
MKDDLLVSICIPTYEMNGKGFYFLDLSFSRIYNQTYKKIEVIVSDQSNDYSVIRACSKWSDKINIKYFKDDNRGKSSMNINNALSKANGELVKILFQDDFLLKDDSIEIIVNEYKNSSKKWYVSSSINIDIDGIYDKTINPTYIDDIYLGENTIGSPSVIIYKNEKDYVKFDDDLVWLMDCDYYKRLFDKYGDPHIINDVLVGIRVWDSSYTNLINDDIKEEEKEKLISKYGMKNKVNEQVETYIHFSMTKTDLFRCSCGEIKDKIRYNFCQKCNKLY